MNENIIRIGSRESHLAVIQSELVIRALCDIAPDTQIELVTMKTTGDLILNQPLDQIGGKGLFIKELDAALREKRCDLSVHSLKDMPMEIPEDLPIVAYSLREDPRDVLVLRSGLKRLPDHPVIGTGSRRRTLQAAQIFPDAEFKGIRGNLLTRLLKLDSGEYDALILAAAGLIRLNQAERIYRYFSTKEMIPSAGQGIMVVQGRNETRLHFVKKINCEESMIAALAERNFVRILDGGCSSPIAAFATVKENELTLRGLYFDDVTNRFKTGVLTGSVEEPEQLGEKLALMLKKELENE